HRTATPAFTTALSCPKLGPNTVTGVPGISTSRAETGSLDSLYSGSQAARTNVTVRATQPYPHSPNLKNVPGPKTEIRSPRFFGVSAHCHPRNRAVLTEAVDVYVRVLHYCGRSDCKLRKMKVVTR